MRKQTLFVVIIMRIEIYVWLCKMFSLLVNIHRVKSDLFQSNLEEMF